MNAPKTWRQNFKIIINNLHFISDIKFYIYKLKLHTSEKCNKIPYFEICISN